MEKHLRIQPTREGVRHACAFVVQAATQLGMDEQAVYHCEIAVDEACTNIAEHGAAGEIVLSVQDDAPFLTITIIDNSAPFNPLDLAEPAIESEEYKREPGGWGVFFFKKLMDQVSYAYRDGKNQLTLRKRRL